MIKTIRTAALAAIFTALGVTSTLAEPLKYDDSPYAKARKVVNVVFADYMKGLTGVQVQTALFDLNRDKKAEVFVRFVHSSSCRDKMRLCRTVVLKHEVEGWNIVFDRMTSSVDPSQDYKLVMGPMKVDAVEWTYDGRRYVPTFEDLGEGIELAAVSEKSMSSYAAAFGPSAVKLTKGFGMNLSYAAQNTGEGSQTLLVKMDGGVMCGKISGCPVRLLVKDAGKWKSVLSTSTKGDVLLGRTSRAGHRDIVVQTEDGGVVMGWTGSGYSLSERIEGVKR